MGQEDLDHAPLWTLFGSLPAPSMAAAGEAFLGALLSAQATIVEIEKNHRAAYVAANPQEGPQFDRSKHPEFFDFIVDTERRKYDRSHRINGELNVDNALSGLRDLFGPYSRLTPGFDESAFIAGAARLLQSAVHAVDTDMFRRIAETSLTFAASVRKWAALGAKTASLRAVDELETSVRDRVARENLARE